jgi:hypothetical protein
MIDSLKHLTILEIVTQPQIIYSYLFTFTPITKLTNLILTIQIHLRSLIFWIFFRLTRTD